MDLGCQSEGRTLIERLNECCQRAEIPVQSLTWQNGHPDAEGTNILVITLNQGGWVELVCGRSLRLSERILLDETVRSWDLLNQERWTRLELVHEIGNPLAVLRGQLEFIHDGQNSEKRWHSAFRAITQIGHRLNAVIPGEHQQFGVIALLEAICADLDTLFSAKRVECHLSKRDAVVVWNRGVAYQVLFNLLKNGAEALPVGGSITTDIDITSDGVHVAVKTDGHPLSEDQVDGLFLPGKSTKPGHLGIGLALSRRLSEREGGKLFYQTQRGFVLVIPTLATEAESAGPQGRLSSAP